MPSFDWNSIFKWNLNINDKSNAHNTKRFQMNLIVKKKKMSHTKKKETANQPTVSLLHILNTEHHAVVTVCTAIRTTPKDFNWSKRIRCELCCCMLHLMLHSTKMWIVNFVVAITVQMNDANCESSAHFLYAFNVSLWNFFFLHKTIEFRSFTGKRSNAIFACKKCATIQTNYRTKYYDNTQYIIHSTFSLCCNTIPLDQLRLNAHQNEH